MGYLKKFEEDISACAAEGLISNEQAGMVVRRVSEKRRSGVFSVTGIIATLAGLSIIAGISLLVASNWETIDPIIKIAGFLLLVAGVGEAAQRLSNKVATTVFQVLWFALPIAGIGLYGQIFQLSGDPIKPVVVWAILSLPLAFCCENRKIAFLEAVLVFATMILGLKCNGLLNIEDASGFLEKLMAWGIAAGLLASVWSLVLVRIPRFRIWAGLATLAWAAFVVEAMGLSPYWQVTSAMLCAGAAMLTFWSAESEEEAKSVWPLFLLAGVLYFYGFGRNHHNYWPDNPFWLGLLLPACIYIAGVLTVLFSKVRLVPGSSGYEWLARTIFLGAMLLPLVDSVSPHMLGTVAANALLLVSGIALIRYGGQEASTRCINYGIWIVVIVLLTRIVELLGSLFMSGLGFLGFGILLGGFAYVANMQRKILIARAVKGDKND